jgi:hypothetical protein
MNIFLLATPPAREYHAGDYLTHLADNAAAHCDRHVISQIKESVQMLVTALPAYRKAYLITHVPSPATNPCLPLAAGHAKHPCVEWASSDIRNLCYLARLANALCEEKNRRWPMNPRHQYNQWIVDLNFLLDQYCNNVYWHCPRYFAVAVKNDALQSTGTIGATAVEIYRDYYIRDKSRFATWKAPASVPDWFAASTILSQQFLS